jgi:uncharacterized phage protein gp47/JayE
MYQYINETGTVIPAVDTLLGDVGAEYRAVFGADLDLSPETSQGVLIAAEVSQRDALVRNNAALANQINPNIAGGLWLDAIAALTGLTRKAATRSTVSATLSGVAGTLIPALSQAKTYAGDKFELLGDVTLNASGMATGFFQSVETGEIPCGSNQLNDVGTTVLGWETVNNDLPCVLGQTTQSDIQFRNLRRNTLALQGQHTPLAIKSALWNLAGVKGVLFRENIGAAPALIDGVMIDGHSIYCVVNGGTDLDIARTILNKKSDGCGYTGTTTVTVIDPTTSQAYDVQFTRPTEVPIHVRVTISRNSRSSIVQDVRYAITQYTTGNLQGSDDFNIGTAVSPYELAGAINIVLPGVYVKNVEIGTVASGGFSTTTLPMNPWELPVIASTSIQVVTV